MADETGNAGKQNHARQIASTKPLQWLMKRLMQDRARSAAKLASTKPLQWLMKPAILCTLRPRNITCKYQAPAMADTTVQSPLDGSYVPLASTKPPAMADATLYHNTCLFQQKF
ncbi:MAG: hypothetical protein M0Z43_05745 [Acidithiobacillus sp.]|nr:hypothetical protein [Acidithiobacillus sp.]